MRLIDADALPQLRHGGRGGLIHWKDIENAPTVDAVEVVKDMLKGEMRLTDADAVQGEKMSNQRVIEWVPVRERKPHLPGIYLVTAQVFTGDILSMAAYFTPNGFLLDGVIAWAEMPAVWTDEEEQLTLF